MRVTYRANRMAVNARGAVSGVPSVLSSLLFVGNRNRKGLATLLRRVAFSLFMTAFIGGGSMGDDAVIVRWRVA